MNVLYLTAIGKVGEGVLSVVDGALQEAFGFAVRQMAALEIPGGSFDTTRRQHSSERMLRALHDARPADALRLLGITSVDLFIPMLSFVYGQAQLKGQVAVVSYARLKQEFYGLPGNEQVTQERTMKEAIHEIGHTFGLTHCIEKSCPMSLSTGIVQLDAKGSELCGSCRIVLREYLHLIDTTNNY